MGTPNLSGLYEGYINIAMRPSAGDQKGQLMAFSSAGIDGGELIPSKITLDFDNKVAVLEDGTFTPATNAPMPSMYVYFKARGDADFTEVELPMEEYTDPNNPDVVGLYKITYYWKMTPSSGGSEMGPAETDIILEISQLNDGSLAFVTVVNTEGNNWIPGTPLPPPPAFPGIRPTPDWRGRVGKKMALA